MPIIDIQRNHMTIFNIRLGEKITTKSGKEAPARLTDQIRVTSPNPHVVEAFVAQYGGHTQPWADQWEAYLPIVDLPIMVLPGQSISQWWERYRGGICDRRCEGTGGIEKISGRPCMCDPDIDERMADKDECSLMTRLHFMCPEVEVIGAGALVSHGRIAAETLPQAILAAEAALAANCMVPAVLRVTTKLGKNRQYVVPQIEMTGLSLRQLMTGQLDALSPVGQGTHKSDAITMGSLAIEAPVNPIREAYNRLDEVAQRQFRKWWKDSGLPSTGGLDSTLAGCPEQYVGAVMGALADFEAGEIPDTLRRPEESVDLSEVGQDVLGTESQKLLPEVVPAQGEMTQGSVNSSALGVTLDDPAEVLKVIRRELDITIADQASFASKVLDRKISKLSALNTDETVAVIKAFDDGRFDPATKAEPDPVETKLLDAFEGAEVINADDPGRPF